MTVCSAVISEKRFIIGASDRLITFGDIQFEPETSKIRLITNSIAILTAGDSGLQRELIDCVMEEAASAIAIEPERWLRVSEVADMYCRHWMEAKRRRAEAAVLAPLGLTLYDFLERQSVMSDRTVEQITNAIIAFAPPPTECLVTGIDERGAHIYRIIGGVASCADDIGFASIGMGGRHSDSQLMLAQYAPGVSVPEALLLLHSAKKRAEVAPGVGRDTDLFFMGAQPGSFTLIHDDITKVLDEQFRRIAEDERQALATGKASIQRTIQSMMQSAATPSQQSGADLTEPTAQAG